MIQEYIISAYTENHIGLLNRITIIFTRRNVNIESLTVSESALAGISKFTIVVRSTEDKVHKIASQIEKHVEVLKAFYHTNDEMVYQEIALYKMATTALIESNRIEQLIRKYNARILEVTPEFTAIEKTGHNEETQAFFEELNEIGVLQFIRSGRVAITRDPIEKLSEFLKERDKMLNSIES